MHFLPGFGHDGRHEPRRDGQDEARRDGQDEARRDGQDEARRDAQHEPRRRRPGRHALRAAAGIAAGLLVPAGLGGALLLGRAASDQKPARPAPTATGHTIRYEVDGGSATIVYRSAAGASRLGAVQLPWSRQMWVPGDEAASVVAWDRGSGYVACRLYVDGALRAGQESTGATAVATCSVG
ncbi:MmpS family transport accessory protein [Actinoplanes sp. CA-030573]|uniref:MmpS family transport accessory protein n=1 Tax=Actinoplanes sp. CA-030573 TaxID=3239898 RepID=UPI003D8BE3E0